MQDVKGENIVSKFEKFEELWWNSLSPTVWCEKYQHPLHRFCPVVLNYENLPLPFKDAVRNNHEGKTGDIVHLTPRKCFECERNILNGGTCDPI